MKKKKIITVLGAAAVAILVCGTAVAVANFQSDPVKASQNLDLKSLSVGIDVEQDFEGKTLMPGQTIVEALNVENTADTPVYIRVIVKGFATNEDGMKIYQEDWLDARETVKSVRLANLETTETGVATDEKSAPIAVYDAKVPVLDIDLAAALEQGWILGYQDNEETVLYYKYPVSAGDTTTNVFSSVKLSTNLDDRFEGMGMTVTVKTDAIQATSGEAAMMSEWGVMATIDSNGVITEISE